IELYGNEKKIIIHFHQDQIVENLIKIFDDTLTKLLTELNISGRYSFTRDFPIYKKNNYNTDILISFSQCAGLDSKYLPGDFLVSETFIPFNVNENKILINKSYKIKNDLVNNLDKIINKNYHKLIVNYVNETYISDNLSKINHHSDMIKMKDFYFTNILQVNDLWNPVDEDKRVYLEYN